MSTSAPGALGLAGWSSGPIHGLHVVHRNNGDALGTVVCVHGTLDRAGSFARVARRLKGADVVCYDRRGYQGSRGAAAGLLSVHVDDLLEVIAEVSNTGPVTVVGHSFGGIVALAAALAAPSAIENLVLYEPPLPWLHATPPPHRGEALTDEPGIEVERFFGRMVSKRSWDRLSDAERADRIADGPALVGDLNIVRLETPFTLAEMAHLACPVTVALGSTTSLGHHAEAWRALAATAPAGQVLTIEGAGHGAHLTHPDHLAAVITSAITDPPSAREITSEETPCAS